MVLNKERDFPSERLYLISEIRKQLTFKCLMCPDTLQTVDRSGIWMMSEGITVAANLFIANNQ